MDPFRHLTHSLRFRSAGVLRSSEQLALQGFGQFRIISKVVDLQGGWEESPFRPPLSSNLIHAARVPEKKLPEGYAANVSTKGTIALLLLWLLCLRRCLLLDQILSQQTPISLEVKFQGLWGSGMRV